MSANILVMTMAQRAMGQFPLSIPTSLALEGFLGIHPELPTPQVPPVRQHQELWVNLRTLVRNVLSSLTREASEMMTHDVLANTIVDEINMMVEVLRDHSADQCQLRVYYCKLGRELKQEFPNGLLREAKTDRQKQLQSQEELTCHQVMKTTKILVFKTQPAGNNTTAAIITHHPLDLLAQNAFRRLNLLESHTGKLKPSTEWHTKLTNGKELPIVPLNRFTIQFFGDNGVSFQSYPIAMRRVLIELIKQDNWTPITTLAKIRQTVKRVPDKEIQTQLLKLF